MKQFFFLFFTILLIFYESFLYIFFCQQAFQIRKKRVWLFWVFILLMGFCSSLRLFTDLPSGESWIMLIPLIYVLLFFDNHILDKVFWVIIMAVIAYGTKNLCRSMIYWSSGFRLFSILNRISDYFRFQLLSDLFLTISLQILARQKKYCIFDKKSLILLGIINIFCLCIVDLMFALYFRINLQDLWLLLISALSFFISILSIVLYRSISSFIRDAQKQQELMILQRNTEEKLAEISRHYDTLRTIKHDLSNHINIVKQLYSEGKQKEGDLYINQVRDGIVKNFFSGCEAFDALFAIKYAEFEKEGIPFHYEINTLSALPVKDSVFCSIISNLLDNALESMKRQRTDILAPCLELVIRRNRNLLQINCSNPVDTKSIIIKDNVFLSSKKGGEHGLGIPSIRKLTADSHGTCYFEVKDGYFVADIWLPYKS